jgi:hypothetical protein
VRGRGSVRRGECEGVGVSVSGGGECECVGGECECGGGGV